MKRLHLAFAIARVPVDALMIVGAGLSAYFLRISPTVTAVLPVRFAIDFTELLRSILLVAACWIVVFALGGLYVTRYMSLREEVRRTIYAICTGMMLVFSVVFFQQEIFESRFIVLAAWGLAMIYIILARVGLRFLLRALMAKGYGRRTLAVVGSEASRTALVEAFRVQASFGTTIGPAFDHLTPKAMETLTDALRHHRVHGILVSDPAIEQADRLALLRLAERWHGDFLYTADLFQASVHRLENHTIAGTPILEVRPTPLYGWGSVYKRAFDVVGSLVLLVVFSPILLAEAIAIKLDSRGPVFFSRRDDGSQLQRVGRHGRPFPYFKFRSMQVNSDSLRYTKLAKHNTRSDGPLVKIANDPRITRVGHITRRLSLDELAEFFLVLRGHMSLVGPRPHLPEEVDKYKDEWRKVLSIKPGITGMAQISGRANLAFQDEVRLDTYYIEHWSPWLDLWILLKTPMVVLGKKGAG
jgi:exopolysaccharide biosynthesis polyprenyl glycosylphosphotransferase